MSHSQTMRTEWSGATGGREVADVVLGGLTIGFALVELDGRGDAVDLSSVMLYARASPSALETPEAQQCGCRSEELAFAKVRPRHGGTWTLGVKVCARHRRLRAA
jgi:hypothetical protein